MAGIFLRGAGSYFFFLLGNFGKDGQSWFCVISMGVCNQQATYTVHLIFANHQLSQAGLSMD